MTNLGMRDESLIVDNDIIAGRLVHLQKWGVILYVTIDFSPSKDAFEEWAYCSIGKHLKIKIEKIKVITRFTFL